MKVTYAYVYIVLFMCTLYIFNRGDSSSRPTLLNISGLVRLSDLDPDLEQYALEDHDDAGTGGAGRSGGRRRRRERPTEGGGLSSSDEDGEREGRRDLLSVGHGLPKSRKTQVTLMD